MHVFLSPSKDMDFSHTPDQAPATSEPLFASQSFELIKILRDFSLTELRRCMDISEKLAQLNLDRYKAWSPDIAHAREAKAAILAFDGEVYGAFDAKSITSFSLAQDRLLILSGLYGILRPLDLIQAYRLEMGRRIFADKGLTLPAFWRASLKNYLADLDGEFFVNLASLEYTEAIPKGRTKFELFDGRPLYHLNFYDKAGDEYKIKGFFAKKARGALARVLCEKKSIKASDLTSLSVFDYRYNEKLSTEFDLAFTR